MSLAAIIDALVDAGATPQMIAAAVRAAEAAGLAEKQTRRAKDAERQRKSRASRSVLSRDVTVTACDIVDIETSKEMSPTPPERNQPLSKENPPKGGQKKGFPLPADWQPTEADWLEAIRVLGRQKAEAELAKFRDYWPGIPGSKGCKLDWHGTWRNWVRNAAGYARGSPKPNGRNVLAQMATGEYWENSDEQSGQLHGSDNAFPDDSGAGNQSGNFQERPGVRRGAILDLRPEGPGRNRAA